MGACSSAAGSAGFGAPACRGPGRRQRAWTKASGLGAEGWKTTGTSAGGGVGAGGLRKHEATGWGRYMLTVRAQKNHDVVEW